MTYGGGQTQIAIPTWTKWVKNLVIINAISWVLFVLVIQNFFQGQPIYSWFGLVPDKVVNQFAIWQFFTYMFLHSSSPFPIIFNMLIL